MTDKTEHRFARDRGGEGMSNWIQSRCTCGWKSKIEYAYEDYQHTNISDQEGQHIASTKWWLNK
jgi:hypothetical protein